MAQAQDILKDWYSVPASMSGFVFVVPPGMDFNDFVLRSDGQFLDGTKWDKEFRDKGLTFVKQYRVPPGEYEVHAPGPVAALRIAAKPSQLVFVQLSPYQPSGQIVGVSIDTWIDYVEPDLSKAVASLHEAGGDIGPIEVDPPGQEIYFDTDPPWPLPPPPKK